MSSKAKQTKRDDVLHAIQQLVGRIDKLDNLLASVIGSQTKEREKKQPALKPLTIATKKVRRWRFPSILFFLIQNPIGVAVTTLTTILAVLTACVQLRYDVSVMPYSSLDPSDPSESRFLATNQGPFMIYNVFYLCRYVPPQVSGTPLVAHGSFVPVAIPSLRPHGEFSLYCAHPASYPFAFPEGTFLDLEVTYTPKFLPWAHLSGGTLFLLKFDKDGNAVWMPIRDMTPRAEDLQKMTCATCSK